MMQNADLAVGGCLVAIRNRGVAGDAGHHGRLTDGSVRRRVLCLARGRLQARRYLGSGVLTATTNS